MTEERLTEMLEQHEHDRPCTCVADLVAEVRRLQELIEQGRCPHDSLTARAHHETGWHPT